MSTVLISVSEEESRQMDNRFKRWKNCSSESLKKLSLVAL
jgi:hypothetical protein